MQKNTIDSKKISALTTLNESLVQFIIRLSSFYEGLSAEADTELRKLRNHLSGKPDYTLASVSINKLTTFIRDADTSVKQHTQVTVKQLEKAIRTFQKNLHENSSVVQQGTQLLTTLQQPVNDLFELQSHCLKAIKLFCEVTNELSSQSTSSEYKLDVATHQGRQNGTLFEEIQNELSQLIESYAEKQPEEPKVIELRARLMAPLSEQELLQTCIHVIRLVVTESMHEATLSGRIIYRIHHALAGLQDNVQHSIDSSSEAFLNRQISDEYLATQLSEMGQTVRNSASLAVLKEQARFHIDSISAAIADRNKADSKEQQVIMALLSTMQTQMESLQRQTQLYRRKLAEQTTFTHTDPLTHLPNRLAYNERFLKEYELARQDKRLRSLSLAVIDIDFFKSINDRFGHQAGDKTLQVVGQHLKKQLRGDEFIARWGGEEFVMILPATEAPELMKKLDDMRLSLAQLPFKFKQEKISITASFGGTCLRDDDEPSSIFARADELLYQAKKNGRNRVVVE